MENFRTAGVTATLIMAFLWCEQAATVAQTRQPAADGAIGLAVEIERDACPPSVIPVPGAMWAPSFGRIEGWQLPPGALPVQAVDVAAQLEGDQVKLDISLHRGKKYHDEKQHLATHFAREGERIVVAELEQHGIKPITLTVVGVVKAEDAGPPAIANRTQSIEVVGVERRDAVFPVQLIRLRNNSSRGVLALVVLTHDEAGGMTSSGQPHRHHDQVLIEPGAIHELHLRAGGVPAARGTPGSYRPQPASRVIIEAATFVGGAYEGGMNSAVRMRVSAKGRQLQVSRILAVISAALDAPSSHGDGAQAVENFRRQLTALDEVADPTVLEELSAEFPAISAEGRKGWAGGIEFGLHHTKMELLNDLKRMPHSRPPSVEAEAFRFWLLAKREVYEQWLARF